MRRKSCVPIARRFSSTIRQSSRAKASLRAASTSRPLRPARPRPNRLMAKTQRNIVIAGGGIGGLTAAIAFARRGINTTVLERSSFADQTGAGIQLGPNATRILKELGVLDVIRPAAFRPDAMWLYDGPSGRQLQALPLGKQADKYYGAPYLTLHSADLHDGLHSVAEKLAPVKLKTGFDATSIKTDGDTVLVRSADGVEAKGSCLIGADGLWCAARELLFPRARLP